ncbi:MAG: phosphoglycolate phosphatase [Alphaproteobacteria bacterium]|nr:phosphoglycolate phosphatase [Alphaproteobacteria bacterium]
MNKTVIFDLDGTLIDSLGDIHAALNGVLHLRNAPPLALATVRGFIGKGSANLVMRALQAQDLAVDDASCSAALADFLRLYSADSAKLTSIFDGAIDTLGWLQDRGFRLGICTNKPLAPTKIVLDQFGLTRFFDTIVGGDQLASRKPDPTMLFHAMASLDAKSCLFVGDSEIDRETAIAAGQPFALFTKGYRNTSVEMLKPEYYFNEYSELIDIVNVLDK